MKARHTLHFRLCWLHQYSLSKTNECAAEQEHNHCCQSTHAKYLKLIWHSVANTERYEQHGAAMGCKANSPSVNQPALTAHRPIMLTYCVLSPPEACAEPGKIPALVSVLPPLLGACLGSHIDTSCWPGFYLQSTRLHISRWQAWPRTTAGGRKV